MPVLAERVAIEKLQNPTKSIAKIAVGLGLSKSYANTGQIAQSQAFQNVIAKWRDKTAQRLQKKSNIALSLITKKTLRQHSAKDLMSIVDTSIKNTQLLSGGATENILVKPILGSVNINDNEY